MDIGRIQQNIAKLVRRAVVDQSFRSLCLTNKAAAYKLVADEEWPVRLCIRFVEQGLPADDEEGQALYLLPPFLSPTWLG